MHVVVVANVEKPQILFKIRFSQTPIAVCPSRRTISKSLSGCPAPFPASRVQQVVAVRKLIFISCPLTEATFYVERPRASGSSSASERNKEPASPFVHTSHGNPAFAPQKVTGKTSTNVSAWSFSCLEDLNLSVQGGSDAWPQGTEGARETIAAVHAVLAQGVGQR